MEGSALVRDFAIIMAVAGVAVVVFRRFNQPPILGYLIAGVIVGPFTLPNPPVTNQESIRLLADLGLVVLLFAVGLELGWRRIRQVGMGVLLIGTVEMLVMSSLGYQVGQMMGWTAMESVFLGAALAISSSAMLIKVLADAGQLKAGVGRIVVGILVVEDFVAVILLTVLSGVASTGSAEPQDIGLLVLKIGVFGVASLALGAIIVPRIVGIVASYRSPETLMLTSLALCFLLSLFGQMLGISAAAGAFLIGAVIGDTRQSEQISHVISPIRDMFGALFFVSIGMLVDIYLIKDHLLSATIIAGVFIVGKVFGASLGTFATGRSGQISLNVGTRMGQVGEFSLAIMKVGVESNAIGAFIYQVLVAAAAMNSLIYPYLARSGDRIFSLIDRVGPPMLKRYFSNISEAIQTITAGVRLDSEFGHRVKRSAAVVLLNSMIIVVLIGMGTFAAETAPQIGKLIGLSEMGSGVRCRFHHAGVLHSARLCHMVEHTRTGGRRDNSPDRAGPAVGDVGTGYPWFRYPGLRDGLYRGHPWTVVNSVRVPAPIAGLSGNTSPVCSARRARLLGNQVFPTPARVSGRDIREDFPGR